MLLDMEELSGDSALTCSRIFSNLRELSRIGIIPVDECRRLSWIGIVPVAECRRSVGTSCDSISSSYKNILITFLFGNSLALILETYL